MADAGYLWTGRDVDEVQASGVIGPLESEYLAALDQLDFARSRGYDATIDIAVALNMTESLNFIPEPYRTIASYQQTSKELEGYHAALHGQGQSPGCVTAFTGLIQEPSYAPEDLRSLVNGAMTDSVLAGLESKRDECVASAMPEHLDRPQPDEVRISTLTTAIGELRRNGDSIVLAVDEEGQPNVFAEPESFVKVSTLERIYELEVAAAEASARCHLNTVVVPGLELILAANEAASQKLDLRSLEAWMGLDDG